MLFVDFGVRYNYLRNVLDNKNWGHKYIWVYCNTTLWVIVSIDVMEKLRTSFFKAYIIPTQNVLIQMKVHVYNKIN